MERSNRQFIGRVYTETKHNLLQWEKGEERGAYVINQVPKRGVLDMHNNSKVYDPNERLILKPENGCGCYVLEGYINSTETKRWSQSSLDCHKIASLYKLVESKLAITNVNSGKIIRHWYSAILF